MAKLVIEDSGFSLIKLAKLFNVARSTLYLWMQDEKEFSDTVEKARDFYDGIKIHKALIKRAEGFAYTETTKEANTDPESGESRMVTTKKVRKYYPPDVAAIKWWQSNRDAEHWREKQEHQITGKDGGPIQYTEFPSGPLTLEEWQKQVEALNQDKPDSSG